MMSSDVESFFNPTGVAEIHLTFSEAEWNGLLHDYDSNNKNEMNREAACSISGGNISSASPVSFSSVGVRLRGNTSRHRPEGDDYSYNGTSHSSSNLLQRVHYKIKLNNKFDKDESAYGSPSVDVATKKANKDQQLFDNVKALNLKYNNDDTSYVREAFSYDMYRRFGVEEVKTTFARLYIKIGSETERYLGVYLAFEDIDKTFISKRYFAADGVTGLEGTMFKCLWQGFGPGDLSKTDTDGLLTDGRIGEELTDPADNASFLKGFSQYHPSYDLKEDPNSDGVDALNAFITLLTSGPTKDQLEAAFDVQPFLRALAVEAMVGSTDSYWRGGNNYYLYKNPVSGKWTYLPYDNDRTLGKTTWGTTSASTSAISWGANSGNGWGDFNPVLVNDVMAIPEFKAAYISYLKYMVDNNYFTSTSAMARITAMQTAIEPYVTGYNVANDNYPYNNSRAELKAFIEGRIAVVKKECY